ncbi:MAG: FAD-binding oxidoreductase [Actinobacteria bacterium]|nr:FAD-binding oxidoreductase [Actinomycetota bacterium]
MGTVPAATAPLPGNASVVVVGGGVIGASIAFHLAEAGVRDVLLLERGDLAGGSTSKAAGGIRAQFTDTVNIELGARSLVAFEQFPQRPGAEIDLHQVGYLFLHTDAASAAAAEEALALQHSLGVATQLLTAAQARELSPATDVSDVLLATFHPRDGYCSPESVVLGYASAARTRGATIRTGVEVVSIQSIGGHITGVETSAGHVRTPAVICAAGTWSRAVGDMVGVDLPVDPLRRQILVTEPLSESLLSMFPPTMPMTIDVGSTFYLHREGPGVLFGMSYQQETHGFRTTYSEDWFPDLIEAIERRCPALLDVGVAHRWAGLYEDTPDHNALIGEATEVDRFLYATGFSGHGFLMGPAVGEVVRDLWLQREPVINVHTLDARRFAAGHALIEHNIV